MSILSLFRSGRRGIKWKLLPLVQFWFWIRGKPFVEFYAWMIDRQERNNNIEKVLAESNRRSKGGTNKKFKGLFDLSDSEGHTLFLKSEGVKPNQTVLDYGCGFGRTAIPLIKYLDAGKFIGVEISKERIRIAKEYVTREKLDDKNPRWIVSPDLKMEYAADQSVDVIWSLAVISHQPFDDIKIWLHACNRVLKSKGIVFFDYLGNPKEEKQTLKDFAYTTKQLHEAAIAAGFSVEDIQDDRPMIPREWVVTETLSVKLTKN